MEKLVNDNDLELIYDCLFLLYDKYPHKNFSIIKYKYNKKKVFFYI